MSAGLWESGLAVMSDALTRLGERDHDVMVDLEAFRALIRAFDPRIVAAFDADRDRLLRLAAGPSWSARALAVLIASICCDARRVAPGCAGARRGRTA